MKYLTNIVLILVLIILTSAVTVITIDGLYLNFRNTTTGKVGQIYYAGDSLYAKVHDSTFLFTSRKQQGFMNLASSDTTNCTTANVYYKIYKLAGFVDGTSNGFVADGNGKLTFNGQKGTDCAFFGSSDVTANKTCELHYALYKNGSLYDAAESPIDINNPGKSKNININIALPNLKPTDYFEILVRSDNANTLVTHNTLFISILGDR